MPDPGPRADPGHSAQAEVDRLADASMYMFDVPSPSRLAPAIVALSLILGLWFMPFDPDRWYIDWPLYSLVFFAAPALVSAVFCHLYLRLIGAQSYPYRTFLLALANLAIIGVVLIPGKLVELWTDLPRAAVLLFAYSALGLINHLGFLLTATGRWVLALPATLAQPLLGYVPILLAYYLEGSHLFVDWELPVLAAVFLTSFIGAGHVALYIGTRPIKLAFGVDGVGVFRAFLEHWVKGGDGGRKDVEDFFGTFGGPVGAHVSLVRFRERGSGAPIATMVVPSVHPGPWGELAASDMPVRMSHALAAHGGGEVLTLHGASDHDLNPVSQAELLKVLRAAEHAAAGLAGFSRSASPFVREPNGFDACAQAFAGAVVAVHTSAPQPTDDVDGPTGYVIERHLDQAGARPGIFVDGHNCLSPGAGGVSFGSPKARALATRLATAGASALEARREGLRVGAHHVDRPAGLKDVGPMCVQALVVEVGDQTTAWVLLDGNNVKCGLRESLRERALELVDEVEVLTTDTHTVNVMVGGFNPVGKTTPTAQLEALVLEAVEGALGRLRDAEVAAARTEIGDIVVWGKGNTIRLSSAINSAVATSEGALAAAFALASAIAAFATYVLGYAL